MTPGQFEALSRKCLEAVERVCPGVRCEVVPSYFSKESFGDLDILVSKEGFDRLLLASALNAVEVFHQKNAIYSSMGVQLENSPDVFQVDFIEEGLQTYDFALAYYGFNDLGNLLGILVAKYGLKLKHSGLYYYPRNKDEVLGEVLVSDNFEEVLRFLGLSVERFRVGFDTLQSLFDFVADSECFEPELYLLENRNHRSRTRDRKRPTYRAFLRYCEQNPRVKATQEGALSSMDRAHLFFPGLKERVAAVFRLKEQEQRSKSLLNGNLVSELTGLKGQPLGEFLAFLELRQNDSGLREAVLSGSRSRVMDVVKVEFEQQAKS